MCDFSCISPTALGTGRTPRRGRVYSVRGKRTQLAVFFPVSPTVQTKRAEFKRNKQFRKPKHKMFYVTIFPTVSSIPKCYYTVFLLARPTDVKNRTTYVFKRHFILVFNILINNDFGNSAENRCREPLTCGLSCSTTITFRKKNYNSILKNT